MDIFDMWIQNLPEERQFSPRTVPKEKKKDYEEWKKIAGFQETDDYDLAGAFLSGLIPQNGHLGSFDNEGRLLKSPQHGTVWKTAFVELLHDLTGEYVQEVPEDRDEARKVLERIIFGAGTTEN